MDPKKALMKGLKSISRDDFVEALRLFVKDEDGVYKDFDKDKQLRQKYPLYEEVAQMVFRAAHTGEQPRLMHALGVQSAVKILVHIAEGK